MNDDGAEDVVSPGEDGLTVQIDLGVTVDNDAGNNAAAIDLNDENAVTNEGDITASGAGNAGISAGDGDPGDPSMMLPAVPQTITS